MIKHCIICGAEFEAPPTGRKTCSPACHSECCRRRAKRIDHVPLMHTQEAHVKNESNRNSPARITVRNNALNAAMSLPAGQRGPQNRESLHWRLISPDMQVYEVDNLLDWARHNAELFGEEPDNDAAAKRISNGFMAIASWIRGVPSRKRPVTTYKGWGLLQLPEKIR